MEVLTVRLVVGALVMATVAGVALYDLAQMVIARWDHTLTYWASRDARVYLVLMAAVVFAAAHLTYERFR